MTIYTGSISVRISLGLSPLAQKTNNCILFPAGRN